MSVKEQYWKYSLITIILGLGLIYLFESTYKKCLREE